MRVINLHRGESGTWGATLPENLRGYYYTVRVKIDGYWSLDLPDPYVRVTGLNGKRGQIVASEDLEPAGWTHDSSPDFSRGNAPGDAILYELHIRDLGMHPDSGMKYKGKYLSLTETNTRNKAGDSTGLDYIAELGITHVHVLPVQDFMSVDESGQSEQVYNWGYDPLHYFVPEGSYSTQPGDGRIRIREFREMVMALHRKGLRIVMDVVYNHTGYIRMSNLHQLVPGYYYRHLPDGSFSDASGCGNETASERPMMRKLILDSLRYWVEEFHIDGFRFDLMGIHDIETMQLISQKLRAIKPDILLYGEGWAADSSPFPESQRAVKSNLNQLSGIAVFNDDFRNSLKGNVFDSADKGYLGGSFQNSTSLISGLAGSSKPGLAAVRDGFAQYPGQVIQYIDCHDNHCLWDRLAITLPFLTDKERKARQLLGLSLVLCSQGIPFLHAGSEFCRSKQGVENSYKHPDSINAINWTLRSEHRDMVVQIKSLIQIRKKFTAFRMQTSEEIAEGFEILPGKDKGLISYLLHGKQKNQPGETIWIAINPYHQKKKITTPPGAWIPIFPKTSREAFTKSSLTADPSSLLMYVLAGS